MGHSRKRWYRLGSFETLESRRLLAVDLLVEHDPFTGGKPNEEVTRVVRVHNIGDEAAVGAFVRSSLTKELIDPIWERSIDTAKFVVDPAAGRLPDFTISQTGTASVVGVQAVGDINGDGSDDVLFHRTAPWQNSSWRSQDIASVLVLNAASSNVNLADIALSDDAVAITPGGSDLYRPLGDLNGDGYDDLAYFNRVVLGRPDIGQQEQIDVAQLQAGEGFSVSENGDGFDLFGIGDANADGFDDIAVSGSKTRIVWGHADIGSRPTLELSELSQDDALIVECGGSESVCPGLGLTYAAPIGDVNDDSFQDIALVNNRTVLVVWGGPTIKDRTLDVETVNADDGFLLGHTVFGMGSHTIYYPSQLKPSAANDLDGDGVDDLLLSFGGGQCSECTATDRGYMEVTGGAVVVFGSADLASDGRIDLNQDRTRSFKITVPYTSPRPRAMTFDRNHDGRSELAVATDEVSYVVNDVLAVTDSDLDYPFLGFNGANGYGQKGNHALVDINRDGELDELLIKDDPIPLSGKGTIEVFLHRKSVPTPVRGEGNIAEDIDIPAGASVVYTIRGRRRDGPDEITSTVVTSAAQTEKDLRNNVASRRSGVKLKVELEYPDSVSPREEVEIEVRLSNSGPSNAQGVLLQETFSSQLENVEWTRTDKVFRSVIDLEELQGADGAKFIGPDRLSDRGVISLNYDGPRCLRLLGETIGSAGDVNDDGIDDFVATAWCRGFTGFVFFGREHFGGNGEIPYPIPVADITPETNSELSADVNGDGFLDSVTSVINLNVPQRKRYVRVVLGTKDGIPSLTESDLDGTNGYVIRTSLAGPTWRGSVPAPIATGDVNHDGFDDILVGDGIRIGDPDKEGSFVPAAYLVFGGPNPRQPAVALADATNVVRMDAARRDAGGPDGHPIAALTVASNIDINGDGVDDIIIGDLFGGAVGEGGGGPVGMLYVVFGRQQHSMSGAGALSETLDVPIYGEVTYKINGNVTAATTDAIFGRAWATPAQGQVHLDPRSATAIAQSPLLGDLDANGSVGFADFLILASNFGKQAAGPTQGDLDNNGSVDFEDFVILQAQFGARL